ncbi:hypothetical protein I656_00825 [Geobacillus sp. WSUCF1]|nr:hypothetical protein I656_00825 [Geobacillus sp. WSUCF1]
MAFSFVTNSPFKKIHCSPTSVPLFLDQSAVALNGLIIVLSRFSYLKIIIIRNLCAVNNVFRKFRLVKLFECAYIMIESRFCRFKNFFFLGGS